MSDGLAANYFSVNPSYTVSAERNDVKPGFTGIAPSSVLLTNVWSDEVNVVVEILRRMGMDKIMINRNHSISFNQTVTKDV